MTVLLTIICFFLASVCFAIYIMTNANASSFWLGFMFAMFLFVGNNFLNQITDRRMKPMDVYQGKTTLEYKVIDGEIVDSCVVWKK